MYGAFKYTCSILHLLIFLVSGVFWNLLLFLSACSAILLGDVIASKKRKIHEENMYVWSHLKVQKYTCTGWLRLVGSLKWDVSFAEYSLFYKVLLQKRRIILRSLLIVATPYSCLMYMTYPCKCTWHTPVHVYEKYSQSHMRWYFRKFFQSSKLKARTSLFTQMWQKRRLSFELWALKQHSKMSPQVG